MTVEREDGKNKGAAAFRKPLEGLLVLDFSQFLSGPSASLRLADLGARVIKIERRGSGDICRTLYISNLELDGDSTLFHSINRSKESFAVDLKNGEDRMEVERLIMKADVLIQNFRPGVMQRLGLDYESVARMNAGIVYGEITGYGTEGPWARKPGQDLLVQSLSGIAWLNGDRAQPPMPLGLAAADMSAGAHLVQGILSALVRKGMTGRGSRVEVSLLESLLDFQAIELTTHLNDGGREPRRGELLHAYPYMAAPYGIYPTKDGFIALAQGSVSELGELLQCESLQRYADPSSWMDERDAIKAILAAHLAERSTLSWLSLLEPAGYPCSDVLDWNRLVRHEAFRTLRMPQVVMRGNGTSLTTTRCPIRIDGRLLTSAKASPRIGEHNSTIRGELLCERN
ncbi:CaiB/BaiF CoA-transferase family protein [Paenibacillus sp. HB172176]|uniref:CaiB/BaiF CoA transferase family protein n=1 Tax=Paenibacillus sp. HB172176 TaxID=2493690 RepID=UPI00143C44BF|nr:CaiB/BaiF CoA-transferase family protein [Paenibacillus sp. HB172176]